MVIDKILLCFLLLAISCNSTVENKNVDLEIRAFITPYLTQKNGGEKVEMLDIEKQKFDSFFNKFLIDFSCGNLQVNSANVTDTIYIPKITEIKTELTDIEYFIIALDSQVSKQIFINSNYQDILSDSIIKQIYPKLNVFIDVAAYKNPGKISSLVEDSTTIEALVGYLGTSKLFYRFYFVKRKFNYKMYGLARFEQR